ncbi:serine/threonine-protein phosphatase [Deltaproteobacteria bacterium Smac51]|nr:serine/threonine-protein phosphatase [Deltaproteobacteria bacterium Smac51]
MTESIATPNKPGQAGGQALVAIQSQGWSQSGPGSTGNQDNFLDSPEKFLWAVADGVTSGVHGDKASSLVIKAMSCLKKPDSLEGQAQEAVRLLSLVNDELWSRREDDKFCATTFLMLLMHAGQAACLWAGDSRCYLFRNDLLYQCTRDHTLRQEHIDRGLLTAAEAGRMIKGHIITNSLGADKDLFYEKVFFDVYPGDRLMLCTDGLSGLLQTELISDVLKNSRGPAEAAERFAELIARREARDDATQITIFISAVHGARVEHYGGLEKK